MWSAADLSNLLPVIDSAFDTESNEHALKPAGAAPEEAPSAAELSEGAALSLASELSAGALSAGELSAGELSAGTLSDASIELAAVEAAAADWEAWANVEDSIAAMLASWLDAAEDELLLLLQADRPRTRTAAQPVAARVFRRNEMPPHAMSKPCTPTATANRSSVTFQ
jgi:hypothetical protein